MSVEEDWRKVGVRRQPNTRHPMKRVMVVLGLVFVVTLLIFCVFAFQIPQLLMFDSTNTLGTVSTLQLPKHGDLKKRSPRIQHLSDVFPNVGIAAFFYASEMLLPRPGVSSDQWQGSTDLAATLSRVLPMMPLEAYGFLAPRRAVAISNETGDLVARDMSWYASQRGCRVYMFTVRGLPSAVGRAPQKLDGLVSTHQIDGFQTLTDALLFLQAVMSLLKDGGVAVVAGTLQRDVDDIATATTKHGFAVWRLTDWLAGVGHHVVPVVAWETEPPTYLLIVRKAGTVPNQVLREMNEGLTGASYEILQKPSPPPVTAACRFEPEGRKNCTKQPLVRCLAANLNRTSLFQCRAALQGQQDCLDDAFRLCRGQYPSSCLRTALRSSLSQMCARSGYYQAASQWRLWQLFDNPPPGQLESVVKMFRCLDTTPLMPLRSSTGYLAAGRSNCLAPQDVVSTNHRVDWTVPRNPQRYCEIALAHSGLCNDDEHAEQCIMRVGAQRLQRVIAIRCSCSPWYRALVRRENPLLRDSGEACPARLAELRDTRASAGNASTLMLRDMGVIPASQVMASEDAPRYVPPSERTPMPMPRGVFVPAVNATVHRLPMSIPEEAIAKRVQRRKWFDINPVKPMRFPTYNFPSEQYSFGRHDEVVAHEVLARSYFAFTHRRGCWTAQRHLDILAAGSVPLFIDLHYCEDYDACLPGYPARLVERATLLPGIKHVLRADRSRFVEEAPQRYYGHNVYNVNPLGPANDVIDRITFNETAYFELAEELLAYTRRYLTTKALATYFLERMGLPEARVVLVTSNWWLPHTVGLINGLAALGVTVITPSAHMLMKLRKGTVEYDAAVERLGFFPGFRGAGHVYGLRANRGLIKVCGKDVDCMEWLSGGKVDLVAYCVSGALNGAPYYDEYVREHYPARRVAFIDGLDQASSFEDVWRHVVGRGHMLFSRELHWQHRAAFSNEVFERYVSPFD